MVSREINLAGRHQKAAVDQVHDPVSEVSRKIWPIIIAAILAQAACHIYTGKALAPGQLDIRVGLIVPQQDVEARLLLLDQIILKRQRFFVVINDDIFNIHRFAQQASRFGVCLAYAFLEIRPHAGAQVLGFTYVNDLAFGIFI